MLCLIVLLVASIAQAQAPAPVRKNVLILNEVGLAHPASALVTEEVMSRLAADHRYQTEFYVESLDSPLFSNETQQRDIESGLLQKYENRKVDVIVAMGPAPIRFLSHFSGLAHDGLEMVEEAKRLNPDIIVADISMPELDGIEAAHRLREMGARASIVFLTIHESPEFVEACLGRVHLDL